MTDHIPWRGRRRRWIALALLVLLATPVWATGTLDCSIADRRVAFSAQTAFSYGFGSSFNNFRATLDLKAGDAPPGFTGLELDGDALVHHWFHGKQVKLHLYHERPDAPAGSAELVIETRGPGGDDAGFAGRYVLTITAVSADGKPRTRVYRGRAVCSAG